MSTTTAPIEVGSDKSIRPFGFTFPQADLDDLKYRISKTKWPDKETVSDASQGVQLATMQALADYWAGKHDWRKIEAKLNSLPQFITCIDGLDIHFIHVRSKHKSALPIIVTHGWPGSIIEQLKIIEPLVDPTAYGGKEEDAFDVVIPSMPGYGFSGKPATAGWGPDKIARVWKELMRRLGYRKYVAQGGDWGAVITDLMAVDAPPELIGIHTNMPGIFPDEIDKAAFSGAPASAGLSTEEKTAYERLQFVYQKGIAYGYQMGLRPQTLYGIADSPVGLAAYFLDHDARSYALITRVFNGESEGLTKDDILDNITITWLTNTALSGARLYWENWGRFGYFNVKGVRIPVAVSVYPDELYPAPKSWTEKAYPNLIHYNRLDKGGHFAAWEQPESFVKELRVSFRSLR
jgi:pimeloyl-ACP methyl ester carboxylesterase